MRSRGSRAPVWSGNGDGADKPLTGFDPVCSGFTSLDKGCAGVLGCIDQRDSSKGMGSTHGMWRMPLSPLISARHDEGHRTHPSVAPTLWKVRLVLVFLGGGPDVEVKVFDIRGIGRLDDLERGGGTRRE